MCATQGGCSGVLLWCCRPAVHVSARRGRAAEGGHGAAGLCPPSLQDLAVRCPLGGLVSSEQRHLRPRLGQSPGPRPCYCGTPLLPAGINQAGISLVSRALSAAAAPQAGARRETAALQPMGWPTSDCMPPSGAEEGAVGVRPRMPCLANTVPCQWSASRMACLQGQGAAAHLQNQAVRSRSDRRPLCKWQPLPLCTRRGRAPATLGHKGHSVCHLQGGPVGVRWLPSSFPGGRRNGLCRASAACMHKLRAAQRRGLLPFIGSP